MSRSLTWHVIAHGDDAFVPGAEIDAAAPDGFHSRFAVYSVRTISYETGEDGNLYSIYDVFYRVRDAEAAPDRHFDMCGLAPIFGEYATLDDALTAIEPYRVSRARKGIA